MRETNVEVSIHSLTNCFIEPPQDEQCSYYEVDQKHEFLVRQNGHLGPIDAVWQENVLRRIRPNLANLSYRRSLLPEIPNDLVLAH